MKTMPTWPNDADGDVLRRLWNDNVDFNAQHEIDFQIDFEKFPPKVAALELLRTHFPKVNVIPSSSDGRGYVEISKNMILEYSAIAATQESLTEMMRPFGGRCECWGMFSN